MAIINSTNEVLSFAPPSGTPSAQIKGTYADSYEVTDSNKSTFLSWFNSYDTLYFGNLTISTNLNIPHKKTIVVNGLFTMYYPFTITVGPNTGTGLSPGVNVHVNYDSTDGQESSTYYRDTTGLDDAVTSWKRYIKHNKFTWHHHRKASGGGHGSRGGDSSYSKASGSPWTNISYFRTYGDFDNGPRWRVYMLGCVISKAQLLLALTPTSHTWGSDSPYDITWTGGGEYMDSNGYGAGYNRDQVSFLAWESRAQGAPAINAYGISGSNPPTVKPNEPINDNFGGSQGGGGSKWNNDFIYDTVSKGGGAIKIMAKSMYLTGIIRAEGERSKAYAINTGGGDGQYPGIVSVDTLRGAGYATDSTYKIVADSGAGSGGGIWLVCDKAVQIYPGLSVAGGAGKLNMFFNNEYMGGGEGGQGIVRIDYGSNMGSIGYWDAVSAGEPWTTGTGYPGNSSTIFQTLKEGTWAGPSITSSYTSDYLVFGNTIVVDKSLTSPKLNVTATNAFGALSVAPTISFYKPDGTNVISQQPMTASQSQTGVWTYSYTLPTTGNIYGLWQYWIDSVDQSMTSASAGTYFRLMRPSSRPIWYL